MVFAGKELVTNLSCEVSVIGGFIKDVVASRGG